MVGTPQLIKVACPHCGAGMRINVQSQVATCEYCHASSFVHVPNRPDPPMNQGSQGYGHIHVPSSAIKAVGAFTLVMVLVPIVFTVFSIIGVAGFIFWAGSRGAPKKPSVVVTTPPEKSEPNGAVQNTSSDACSKAVACCKAVISATGSANQRSCEALRALSDTECENQAKGLRSSAKSLGKNCD